MEKPIKIVVFDMDGTLTEGLSWQLFHDLSGISEEENLSMRALYFNHKINYDEWIRLIEKSFLKSPRKKSDYEKAAQHVKFKKGAEKTVAYLQKKYMVHISSSSIDMYVAGVAKTLNIKDFHANHTFHFDKDDVFSGISYFEPESRAKITYIHALSKKYAVSLDQIVHVGDSWGDNGAFKLTKHGILLGNDPKMKTVCWKQVQQLEEIQTIL